VPFVLLFDGLDRSAAHAASSDDRTTDGFALVEPMKGGTCEAEYSTIADDGTLEEKSGEFKADFGTIEVPENRRDPDKRTIRLPIIRIRATGEEPAEPIFWFAGGPGQSNMETFRYDYFIPNRDHVMVGYRGVDGSVSLACKEVVGVLEDAKDVLTDETIARVGDAYAACANRHERNGVDIDGYTTLDVVEDVEAARKALGYEKIDIVAESYGTRLAYLYGVRYPGSINRTAMIGANPPGDMVWDPPEVGRVDQTLRGAVG
jgi:pimeloyl-ACP methyl ester carboxylesterase